MAVNPPGSAGWAISGDKTVEFARSPLEFLEKRIRQHGSRIFLSRALNKPTIFVTSNRGVKEILIDKGDSFDLGYRDFGYIHDIYGDVLLFDDGEKAARIRSVLGRLFDPKDCQIHFAHCKYVADEFLSNLSGGDPVALYETLKKYTTALCISLFLNIHWTDPEYTTIRELCTRHWHGLISVPVSLEVRGWTSSFGKAMKAKDQLLNTIKAKLSSGAVGNSFIEAVKESGFENVDEAAIHMLIFVSALIPKALASLLTSFCITMAGEKRVAMRIKALENEVFLENVLLEVQRLWPPFLGGRRITNKPVLVDGVELQAGVAVGYITWLANRDPEIFSNPAMFIPERWENELHNKQYVWTFGGGPRKCVGIGFINKVLKLSCQKLLSTYNWCIHGEESPGYKTLPVARPKLTLNTYFMPRT